MNKLAPSDPRRPYDRRFEIRGLSSTSLLWTNVPYAYSAPEGGYLDSYVEECLPSRGTGQFVEEWKKPFFIRARSGRLFAGLQVKFESGNNRLFIDGYVNPSASRVLEPDPTKLITDPRQIRKIDEMTRLR
jgi:hypothetical protein